MAFTATPASFTPINIWAMLRALINNYTPILNIGGVPVNGTSGSFAGQAGPGALLIDFVNADLYINTGTLASPLWTPVSDSTFIPLTANGAVPIISGNYAITKAGSYAGTLAAPTPTTQDGTQIIITSNTAFVHVITATGLLQTGTAAVNAITFSAYSGASVTLQAYQGKWNVISSNQVTFQ
jgi:hypothetical protein